MSKMGRLLVIAENNIKMPFLKERYDFIKLRRKGDVGHMMEVFEFQDSYRIISTKDKIEKMKPERIVVVGKLKDYRWLAQVICRVFGQWSSLVEQFKDPYGKTSVQINGKEVELLAFDNVDDWRKYYEKRTQ